MGLFDFGPDLRGYLVRQTQALNTLNATIQQQGKQTMAVIAEVQSLITANQTLIALVNQLIAKINTPPVPSQDVTDTQAAASSELSAVQAAITAAQTTLTPPPQT